MKHALYLTVFPLNFGYSSVFHFTLCNHFQMEPLANRRMDFEEFCAATISPYQLEALPQWEEIASTAFEYFEQEGNRAITTQQLAQVCNRNILSTKSTFHHVFPCVC
jgi:hypothetical protein